MKKILTLTMLWLFCSSLNAQLVINEIFYNTPGGGADSLEFIEIMNNDDFDISLSGYVMTSGVAFDFPDVVLPAGELFLMTKDSMLMIDSFGVSGWQWPISENLANGSEAIVIKDPFGAVVDSVFYIDDLPWPTAADGNGFSMELCNRNSNNSLGTNWYKSETYTGVILGGQEMKCTPGMHNTVCSPYTGDLVITEIMYNSPETASPDSFEYIEIYNTTNESIFLEDFYIDEGFDFVFPSIEIDEGEYLLLAFNATAIMNKFGKEAMQWESGNLSNDVGEEIILRDANGLLVDEVHYDVELPFSELADGDGYSLELCDPALDNNLPISWKISENYIGFQINNEEVFCTPGEPNSVNCFDVNDTVVEVLDNSFSQQNITIFAGETVRWSYAGTGIHNVNGLQANFPGNPESFLSGEPTSGPWEYSHTFHTVGLYNYRCDNHYQQGMTGTVTVLPAQSGDIVITEILYHQPGGENNYDFVEFYNRGQNIVSLSNYFFGEGVEYEFSSIAMDPGEYLVITKDAEAFYDAFGVDAFEWTNGGLNNEGEDVLLSDGTMVIDIVDFGDDAPWPEIADGEGASIMLCDPASDNNNPFNWRFSTTETNVATTTNPNLFIHATPGAPNDTCASQPFIFFGEDIPVEVSEDVDSIVVKFKMANVGTDLEAFIDVVVETSSTATNNVDFSIPEMTVDFDAAPFGEVTLGRLTIHIEDDAIQEFTEKIVISLTNPVNAGLASQGVATIAIIDNDGFNPNLYPEISIGDATVVNSDFVAELDGTPAALNGIVYGFNIHPEGVEFTLIDKDQKNDGINVFRNNNPSNYTVTEGDEVTVYGTITQFNGLTQIIPDNIVMHSADNALHAADTIISIPLFESEESKLIHIKGLTNDGCQNVGPARHYLVHSDDGADYIMRVDDDTDVPESVDLADYFNATGIGHQIDPGDSPYNVGYMFIPRYTADIESIVSIEEPEALKVSVYPNPAKDLLTINTDVIIEQVVVHNLLGQAQMTQAVNGQKTDLDISKLTPGCYLLTCIHQEKMRTVKFIKN